MSAIRFLFVVSLLGFAPAMSGPWFPMAPVRPIGGVEEPQISPAPVDVGKHSPVIISSGPIYIGKEGGGRHSCAPSDYSDGFVLNSAKAPLEDQAGGGDAGPAGAQMQSANPGPAGAQVQSANSGPAPMQMDVPVAPASDAAPAPALSRRHESPRVKKWARLKRSHNLDSDYLEDYFSEGRRSSDDDDNTTGENERKSSKSLLPVISPTVRTNSEERFK